MFNLKAESILIFIDDDNINRMQIVLQYFEAEQVLSPLDFLAEQIIPLFFIVFESRTLSSRVNI